ncbi:MAG: hypothetical protein ABSF80_07510 [Chitinispirillaceae bacterium]|jgi:hypothetical protein
MKTGTAKNRMRMFAGCFLMFLAAGVGSLAVARGGGGAGFHGSSFRGSGFHSVGFHGGGYRYGGFHGSGFRGVGFHGYGWSRGFHHSRFWGGFYIGPVWYPGPTIIVEGVPYYYYSGEYYTPSGDVLVAAIPPAAEPTVTPAPNTAPEATPANVEPKATQPSGEAVTINVPNASGGYTPVKLVKVDKGYVGPQGEFYKDHPTVAELKVLYGK